MLQQVAWRVGAVFGAAVSAVAESPIGRRAIGDATAAGALVPAPAGMARRVVAAGSAVHSGVPLRRAASFVRRKRMLARGWERIELPPRTDGTALVGWISRADSEAPWAVLAHGYRGSAAEMEEHARVWRLFGWNVLALDLRGHGESAGGLIGFGRADREDILAWAHWIVAQAGPRARIVLHGQSMGAASVLGAAADPALPRAVVAVVADSAFTSVRALFDHLSNAALSADAVREGVYEDARTWLLQRGGYDLDEAAPIDTMAGMRVPALFFHGLADDFVPPWMSQELFDACGSPLKRLVFMESAGHCACVRADEVEYYGEILAFVDVAESYRAAERALTE